MIRVILTMVLLGVSLFAQKAILVDVVSENIIKVKKDGEIQKLHLIGIELFSKANNMTKEISLKEKENLKAKTISYIKKEIPLGSEISYSVVYKTELGVEKIWLDTARLNYKMVRDGFALVDLSDEFIPSFFEMRMTIAMKYARDKKIGLWEELNSPMFALIDTSKHMCGWENKGKVPTITKISILKEQQNALPNAARIHLTEKVASIN